MTVHEIGKDARSIWFAGVAAVDARERVRQFVALDDRYLRFGGHRVPLSSFRNILVIGAGKSAGAMAAALDKVLHPLADRKQIGGRVNVPDGREIPLQHIQVVGCRPLGSNLPTERVLESTSVIMRMLQACQPDDLVIALFSGGGSALLEQPLKQISLSDLQALTRLLSQAGASIEELNLVRGQLSQVKAGGLARLAGGRQIISLLISDVLGDPIAAIASGPMVSEDGADPGNLRQQARAIVAKYISSPDQVPASITRSLSSDAISSNSSASCMRTQIRHFVIANNQLATQSAAQKAVELGYSGIFETDMAASPVADVARRMLKQLQRVARDPNRDNQRGLRGYLISGGEPTLDVGSHPGRGGRNQHLALLFLEAVLVEKLANPSAFANLSFSFLSGGTDGEDGNVPVAGAQIDSSLLDRLEAGETIRKVRDCIDRADSFTLLEQLGCLLRVGDTQTNVCDLRVLIWE